MEQNAKQLLKRISEKVGTLTDKKISQVAHAPKENEWRAYIWQTKPDWEDIAWRIKEPNNRGEAEVHLGFYSAKPTEELAQAISQSEELAKGKVSHVIKNENGIRLVWKVNLNDSNSLDKLFEEISNLLGSFLDIAFESLIKSSPNTEESSDNHISEDTSTSQSDPYFSFINQSSDFLLSEKFKVYITSHYFKELLSFSIKYLYFSFTNGNVSIESYNGSDYFELVYDIQNNCVLPISSKYISEDYLNDSDYRYKIYTNSWHSGLDNFHTEFGEYSSWVDFSALGFEWSVILEDVDYRIKGEITDKLFTAIQQCINSKTLYHFLSEILEKLEDK